MKMSGEIVDIVGKIHDLRQEDVRQTLALYETEVEQIILNTESVVYYVHAYREMWDDAFEETRRGVSSHDGADGSTPLGTPKEGAVSKSVSSSGKTSGKSSGKSSGKTPPKTPLKTLGKTPGKTTQETTQETTQQKKKPRRLFATRTKEGIPGCT